MAPFKDILLGFVPTGSDVRREMTKNRFLFCLRKTEREREMERLMESL